MTRQHELVGPWLWQQDGAWYVYWRTPSRAVEAFVFRSLECRSRAHAEQAMGEVAQGLARGAV